MTFKETMSRLGYEIKTTFWEDFSIADTYGVNEIRHTFKQAFSEWKSNYEYLTELVMVLNHKIWYYWERKYNTYVELYKELWKIADLYAMEHLKGEELEYYYQVTD